MSSSSISHMQEFSSVTASSYDADALAPLLSEKSADGWDVVSIVSAGTNIVAYLSRATTGDAVTDEVDTAFVPVPVDVEPVDEEPAAQDTSPGRHRRGRHSCGRAGRRAGRRTSGMGNGARGDRDRVRARAGRGGRRGGACRGCTGRVRGPCRLVRRSVGSLRAALLGWQRLDRARFARRSAVHRSPGRLTPDRDGWSTLVIPATA